MRRSVAHPVIRSASCRSLHGTSRVQRLAWRVCGIAAGLIMLLPISYIQPCLYAPSLDLSAAVCRRARRLELLDGPRGSPWATVTIGQSGLARDVHANIDLLCLALDQGRRSPEIGTPALQCNSRGSRKSSIVLRARPKLTDPFLNGQSDNLVVVNASHRY
ncbi:hypothetical protein BS50DRAFT_1491 [Corynespora cassiicola Philippines]|uniref:Uncharacterized protein n=1 Tax=Corynespora cassiicola Philippines TaxID=1448308 RepID=A0A2T2P851_CORCC|nr:hypothetical protein BS50DRAFT_1491 [Corynespora cassiicola Philippines]